MFVLEVQTKRMQLENGIEVGLVRFAKASKLSYKHILMQLISLFIFHATLELH